jgi:ectoine hydroxylase-related dioxygenase (phytanoyl-CoA dioxygenase family)
MDDAGWARRLLLEEGYVVVRQVLRADEVDEIKRELKQHLEVNPIGRNPFEGFKTKRVYALFNKTRTLDKCATHPLITHLVKEVLQTQHFQLSSTVGIEIQPGEVEQAAHRDDGKYPFHITQDVICNTMWAIDGFTDTNGATVVYPKSKMMTTKEFVDARKAGTIQPIKVMMNPGDVLIYSGSIWHGGGGNTTEKETRLGVLLEYVAAWLRPQENHILAVDRHLAKTLPVNLLELLGYNVHPPFIGYVNGLSPLKALL